MARLLRPQFNLYGIELPGHGSRYGDALSTSLPGLVEDVARDVGRSLTGPLTLFGHSLGGLIAFELARHLESLSGIRVTHLYVMACRAPHSQAGAVVGDWSRDCVLVHHLRLLGGTPEAVFANAELLAVVLPVVRADLALYEEYADVSRVPLEHPITAFVGCNDPLISLADIGRWRECTRGSFQVQVLEGGHFWNSEGLRIIVESIANAAR